LTSASQSVATNATSSVRRKARLRVGSGRPIDAQGVSTIVVAASTIEKSSTAGGVKGPIAA
jgi:hypothetical protein